MAPCPSLAAFLAQLRQAELSPRPPDEDWKALIERLSVPGRIAAIDEETYWYFLEVLPPKFQGQSGLFAFAEGAEELRLFWRHGEQHFARQLTWDETRTFCGLAGVPFPYWY